MSLNRPELQRNAATRRCLRTFAVGGSLEDREKALHLEALYAEQSSTFEISNNPHLTSQEIAIAIRELTDAKHITPEDPLHQHLIRELAFANQREQQKSDKQKGRVRLLYGAFCGLGLISIVAGSGYASNAELTLRSTNNTLNQLPSYRTAQRIDSATKQLQTANERIGNPNRSCDNGTEIRTNIEKALPPLQINSQIEVITKLNGIRNQIPDQPCIPQNRYPVETTKQQLESTIIQLKTQQQEYLRQVPPELIKQKDTAQQQQSDGGKLILLGVIMNIHNIIAAFREVLKGVNDGRR